MKKNISLLVYALLFVPILCAVSMAESGSEHGFSLAEAEKVVFTKNTLKEPAESDYYLSFSAFSQRFDLELQKNEKLLGRLSFWRNDVALFEGKIAGNEKSWARITVFSGRYSGAVFDGDELFLLDVGANVSAALESGGDMANVQTVIYRSSDVTSGLVCAADGHGSHESEFSYTNLIANHSRQVVSQRENSLILSESAEASAVEQLNVRIVVDPEYVASSDVPAEVQVLSQMNIVDGIFSDQVGVQFSISAIDELQNNNNPLISSNASTLLTEFRLFVGDDNPGLAHLFTGRNLDGNTAGVAFVGAICGPFGVGLSQAGGRGMMGALTAAHEFGHNFGSPHDDESGSACADTPGIFLMNPFLNGSDQFSQCSLGQISNRLSSAQCLVPVVSEPAGPLDECEFAIDFSDGTNGFVFNGDEQTPLYSSGSALGGRLNVSIGGVDDNDISDIQGAWVRECVSDSAADIEFSVNASISQSSEYESSEFSQISLRVNGVERVFETLRGDGNGGVSPTTGNQQYTVVVPVNAGINNIELVCFNNLKTLENETTQCVFNSIESNVVEASVPGDGGDVCFPVKASDLSYTLICL